MVPTLFENEVTWVSVYRDESEPVSEHFVVHDGGVLVDHRLVYRYCWDLVRKHYLRYDDSPESVGKRSVDSVDFDFHVGLTETPDVEAEFFFELRGVEAIVDGHSGEAASVLDVVVLRHKKLRSEDRLG